MANTSLKNDIYTYLSGQISLTSLLSAGGIGWGQMPETAVSKTMIVYRMLSDPRIPESSLRNQRWRFWICVPKSATTPKETCLTIANKMLDLLHEVRGSFGSTYIHFSENVNNSDVEYDPASECWMVIQDYMLKMKTLQ